MCLVRITSIDVLIAAICSFVKVLLAKRDVMHLIAPRDANYHTQAVIPALRCYSYVICS